MFYMAFLRRNALAAQERTLLEIDVATGQHDSHALALLPEFSGERRGYRYCRRRLDEEFEIAEHDPHGGDDLRLGDRHHVIDVTAQQHEVAYADESAQTIGDRVGRPHGSPLAAAERLV